MNNLLKLVIVLALAAVGLVFYFRPPPVPLAPPEVSRAKLEFKDGAMRDKRTGQIFTGYMLERYPDSALLSRSYISNGLLNGVSEGWYTNGQIQVREYFSNGVSNGTREKWHPNGTNQSRAEIVNGKIEGTFQSWHTNGVLSEEIPMKAGNPDGLATGYYPSGFLKARTKLSDGKILEQKTWKDGETKDAQ